MTSENLVFIINNNKCMTHKYTELIADTTGRGGVRNLGKPVALCKVNHS